MFHTFGGVAAGANRRLFAVRQRQVIVQTTQHEQRFHVVLKRHVGHTALGGVRDGATQIFGTHLLMRYGLDDLWPGDKHV